MSPIIKNRTLWVHFGQHKTGSTAIQEYLNTIADNHNGICVVGSETRGGYLSGLIKGAFISDVDQVRKKRLARFTREMSLVDTESAIISSEAICHLRGEALRGFVGICTKYFEEVRFLGYIRESASYLKSSFQQALKVRYMDLSRTRNPVYSFLKNLESYVPRDKIQVYSYEEAIVKNTSVTKHFCKVVGVACDNSDQLSKRYNTSLSLSAIKLLYIYRKYLCDHDNLVACNRSREMFLKRLASLQGEGLRFGETLLNQIENDNRVDIAWLESEYGCRINNCYQSHVNGINDSEELMNFSQEEIDEFSFLFEGITQSLAIGALPQNIAASMHILRLNSMQAFKSTRAEKNYSTR